MKFNPLLGNKRLPVDIVLAPEWWYAHEGITFDRDFFFHPLKRVEAEQKMEIALHNRWGQFGLGENRKNARPEIGAVHLAAGYLLSEMMGCKVEYTENHPPQVICAHRDDLNVDVESAFASDAFQSVQKLWDDLKKKYGYLTGDINWGGILNLAMDLRGEDIFLDMMMAPEDTREYFTKIAGLIGRFTATMHWETKSTSISVNRNVRLLDQPVFLHSECSHTMISVDDYEQFLLPFDQEWSKMRPFGIHYCGPDPHRMAASFAKIPHLDYLDVGWGGDIKELRRHLPHTFFSIRLSPVEIARMSKEEIRQTITRLVTDSGNPFLTGVCCINMDDQVSDQQVAAIFETVEELRNEKIR